MRYTVCAMKNKNLVKHPTPENPVAAVATDTLAGAPVAVALKNEFGLTVTQQAQAAELQTLCPAIVDAVKEVSEFEAGLRDKYFGLCRAIRDTQLKVTEGATRGLTRREVTLLLQSLGYSKQRITEINRVVEVPPEIWKQFEQKQMGFRAVLTLARNADKPAPETTTPPTEPLPGQQVVVTPEKEKLKTPVWLQDSFVVLAAGAEKHKLKPTKDDGYEFTVTTAGGLICEFRMFVTKP